MNLQARPSELKGDVTIPPSKSAAHRAIIAAALADGKSVVHNVDLSNDVHATIGACRNLGGTIDIHKTDTFYTLTVAGGLCLPDDAQIDCAESGSTLRFFIPIACALDGTKTFVGGGRLPHRPIDAYYTIFDNDKIAYSKPPGRNLPLSIHGTLKGGRYAIDGGVSSQYITGMLFALPLLKSDSTLTVTGKYESKGYVDMTLSVLHSFGIQIDSRDNSYIIKGNQRYAPREYTVEGDYSQAAFFIVGGAVAGGVRIKGLCEQSLQPDRVIVDIIQRMGAEITRDSHGLAVKKSVLRGTEIDVSQCPDLVPPLAIAAALAEGETRITGAARLRIKESDRLKAMSGNLKRVGIDAEELPDGLIIRGGDIEGGSIDAFNDHRIAMAFSIAAARSKTGIQIDGAECIDKSYPGFYQDLEALGGDII